MWKQLVYYNKNVSRLSEGRSQSLTRAELRNGFRSELGAAVPPTKHHHDDQGKAFSYNYSNENFLCMYV